jgi:ubiquinone/menaquinone biosynthesis C-methylase UbiE
MASITVAHYAAGILGLSVMRQWYRDPEYNEARVDELRDVLSHVDQFPWNLVLDPQEQQLLDGYAEWSASYDGRNPLIEAEEAIVQPILERLVESGVVALDAGCGTGRHTAFLDALGCTCVGIDQSIDMLNVARDKVPAARFELGDLERLPFDDDHFDLAVASLALCHLDDPTTAVVELARVVRPAGSVIVTDPHPSTGMVGGQAFYGGFVDGRPMNWVRNRYHGASRWLSAFRTAGLRVENCIEAPYSDEQIASFPASSLFPAATRAALSGVPSLWVWELSVER